VAIPVALLVAALAQQPAPDAFIAQRDAAASRSPLSSRFSISFADNRRTYRPGEAIPLIFSYDVLSPSPYNYEDASHLGWARAILDHSDGTAYPLADYDRSGAPVGGILGGVRGCLVGPDHALDFYGNPLPRAPQTCPPVTFTVYLNQDVRFDKAGHYRFYVEDKHVSILQQSMGEPPLPALVSNVLEIEITSRDPVWEDQAATAAIALLDVPNDFRSREDAARTLRFLGTDRAIDEMVRRVGRLDSVGADPVVRRQTSHFGKGLFGARDRTGVIKRMEAALGDPKAETSGSFMATLASLSLVQTPGAAFTPKQQRERLHEYQRRRAALLKRARQD
jgi:hypothetical protein